MANAPTPGHRIVPTEEFNLDDVIRLKGHHFKIVLVDGYTGKIGLKWITAEEAAHLEKTAKTPSGSK